MGAGLVCSRASRAAAAWLTWLAAVLLLLGAPGLAQAAWLRAETEHFTIYSDTGEEELREFATKLMTFDAALRILHPPPQDRPASSKLDVYLVGSERQLRRLRPDGPAHLRGYYVASPNGVYAAAVRTGEGMIGQHALLHEYTHRYLLETFPAAYPAWLTEAHAEYLMTAVITPEAVEIGHASPARASWLVGGGWLPLETLLGQSLQGLNTRQRAMFYAQAWLLYHYMSSDPARARQLDAAIKAIADGGDPVESFLGAAQASPSELTRALRRYTREPLKGMRLPNPLVAPPEIRVTRLPASADDLLLEARRIADGAPEKDWPDLLRHVRKMAARHPGDKFAELTLARAEAAMGDPDAAFAIIERRLAQEPEDLETLRTAAAAHLAVGGRDPSVKSEHFRAARPYLGRAFKLAPHDFQLLYSYALARSVEPDFPNENATNVLLLAHQLAPSVEPIAVQAGLALLRHQRRDEALRVLRKVANNPHGGELQARAAALLAGESPLNETASTAAGSDVTAEP